MSELVAKYLECLIKKAQPFSQDEMMLQSIKNYVEELEHEINKK